MRFNHSKLLGRIIEKFGTQSALAASIGWTPTKLSYRINGAKQFEADEIMLLCSPEVLDISPEEIPTYFFTL